MNIIKLKGIVFNKNDFHHFSIDANQFHISIGDAKYDMNLPSKKLIYLDAKLEDLIKADKDVDLDAILNK